MTGKASHGFSLVELAIILVIIGVLAGSFIATLGSRIDTTRRGEAVKDMEVIRQALYGFAMTQVASNLHLPCPDCRTPGCAFILSVAGSNPNDGLEDRRGDGTCATGAVPGNLPWATLGVGRADPWGNRYSYWVSSDAAGITNPPPAGFDLTTNMAATAAIIQDRINGALPTPTPVISDNAVAIVMTQGKNGYGVPTTQNTFNPAVPAANVDEAENLDGNEAGGNPPVFFSRTVTAPGAATAGGEFDDLLVWISEYELKAKMVEAGLLPLP